jgi:hypothetical protein
MNLDCSKLEQMVQAISLVRECDVVRNGALRMSTPFAYPNGDYIEVFLEANSDLFHQTMTVSDYGQTSLYLRSAQTEMDSPAKKQAILSLILSQLNVKLKNGDLYIEVAASKSNDLSDAIFRLSQACLRISDFASHQRLRSENSFRDELEGFFDSSGISYITDVKAPGRYKNEVAVDFEAYGRQQNSYVCVLDSLTNAHASATEIFRKWYDIVGHGTSHNRITVYSDKSAKLRPSDRQRILDYSMLISYPSSAELLKNNLAA